MHELNDIEIFYRYPHRLGHYLGFNDLIELHTEWIYFAWFRNDIGALMAHRNSYKTTSILIIGAIWWLLFNNPDETICFIRKDFTSASTIVNAVRNLFESDALRYLMKEKKHIDDIKTKNWSASSLTISIKKIVSPEGSLEAQGITANVTGKHFGKIFADDIITLDDRISKTEREKTKIFVRELKNIPKHGGNIFYTGTPWHKNDAWEVIPVKPIKFPIGSIPISGYREQELDAKIKELKNGNTESLYNANYKLVHTDDENKLFHEPVYDKWPDKFKIIKAYCDPAYSGECTTSLSMLCQTHDNKYFVRGWVWRKNITELYSTIKNILIDYNCPIIYIETNADKGLSSDELKKYFPTVIGRNEKYNKHMKIISFLKYNYDKLIFADDCNNEYINQITDYYEGASLVDAPDSLASLIREFNFGENPLLKRLGLNFS